MNISKILIGIDDSAFAEHAAAYGFSLARQLNAAVGLVYVLEPVTPATTGTDTTLGLSSMGMPVDGIANPELTEINNNQGKALIQQTVDRYGEGLQVSHFTDYGTTADGILHCSQEYGADLIVLGTHSRSGFERLIMGSVAEKVVRDSTMPVLVVPMNKDKEE